MSDSVTATVKAEIEYELVDDEASDASLKREIASAVESCLGGEFVVLGSVEVTL